jgi:hypothetical protein
MMYPGGAAACARHEVIVPAGKFSALMLDLERSNSHPACCQSRNFWQTSSINLKGSGGLAFLDPAWEALLERGAAVGLRFLTHAIAQASLPSSRVFPDDRGFHYCTRGDGLLRHESVGVLQDSDVVCFRSAPIDTEGVYHALIQVSDDGGHLMPPTATV